MCQKSVQNGNFLQLFLLILFYESKYYLVLQQVYLDNCAYKIVDKQMIDYLNDHLFDSDENQFFEFDKLVLKMLCCDGIDLVKEMMLVRVITVLPATNGVLIMT